MADEPPNTLPRLTPMDRPSRDACGTVVKFQSRVEPKIDPRRPGTLILRSSGAAGPASIRRILDLGRPRLRRVARAVPAVPPPTMICGSSESCKQNVGAYRRIYARCTY